jgi:hypothetical protein
VKRAKATVLHELARKAVKARWAKSTPEDRAATVTALNAARAAKRRTRTIKSAEHRHFRFVVCSKVSQSPLNTIIDRERQHGRLD